jgi:hypothetical protein
LQDHARLNAQPPGNRSWKKIIESPIVKHPAFGAQMNMPCSRASAIEKTPALVMLLEIDQHKMIAPREGLHLVVISLAVSRRARQSATPQPAIAIPATHAI